MSDPTLTDLPVTGIPAVDNLIRVLGAVYVIASVLALVLPRTWTATQWLAKFAADLRGILRKPEPPADEEL
jgi:hypothetical protein